MAWWHGSVVYQVYPRSFCDASGDGVGDLAGVRRHLEHLVWLGVDAVWLSPVYRSPMADFGYDVSDHEDVDPLFGTLDDLAGLVDDAHRAGIRVLLDWVPNHTSDRHPWFVASRSSPRDPKRGWYVWRDGAPGGGPPNNWQQAFTGVGRRSRPPAWTWDEASGQWYLHLFLPDQPDLDWSNPEVRAAMAGTLRTWMGRGVDGFRIDVVQGLGKDPALPDVADADQPPSGTNDRPETHAYLRELRAMVDAWPDPPERVLVGEVYLPSTEQVATYHGTPGAPELHLAFNFPPMFAPWRAEPWRAAVERTAAALAPRGAWPTWVLSNHDNPRHRTRYGSEAAARAAAVLLLGLRGTPFLYAGEELGLEDAAVAPERRVDPGGRDGCRAPLPWTAEPDHGWAGAPWLPWPPGADRGVDVASQRADPGSVLHLYRRLLAARRASAALRLGEQAWLEGATPGVLAWRRWSGPGGGPGADERVVAVDLDGDGGEAPLPPGRWVLEVASGGPAGEGGEHTGRCPLPPGAAALLRPA